MASLQAELASGMMAGVRVEELIGDVSENGGASRRDAAQPTLKARLETIQPATDTVCPFCGAQLLVLGSQCSCPACGVVRNEVERN